MRGTREEQQKQNIGRTKRYFYGRTRVTYFMLNVAVLSFSILSDYNKIHIVMSEKKEQFIVLLKNTLYHNNNTD